ncbi:FprA family A-type flavoprotein [Oscillospiraceae bacterium WX1]
MSVIKLMDGLYSVGVLNPALRVFDVVMKTEYGTSYNAYLLKGEKNVLIDTVHARHFEEYIENVKSLVDLKSLDYIILNHNEPDHSGSLERLIKIAPQIQILTSPAGKIYLPFITNDPMINMRAVRDGETLDIGGGKTLQFIHAPFLHWPDSMFTWFEQDQIAFTCDFLGTHFCEPTMSDALVQYKQAYYQTFKSYFDAIFGPFKSYVQKGLDKLKALDVKFVCPSHGPVLRRGVFLEEAMLAYDDWSTPKRHEHPVIPIFYCSAYGCTGRLAVKIAEGINHVLPAATVSMYDLVHVSPCSLCETINEADAFCIGSPTINKNALPPVWELIHMLEGTNCKGRRAALFGSYGWSGEALPLLSTHLKSLNVDVFEDGCRCRFVPSETELQEAYDFGVRFAKSL